VFVVAAIVLCAGLSLAVAQLGSAVAEKARANSAADAAALAAADALARGLDSGAAGRAAAQTAVDNGGRLLWCHCAGTDAEVGVALGAARAAAHAVVTGEPLTISRSAQTGEKNLRVGSDMWHRSLSGHS
jgi:secretion/DNA translocation related TadE-like protein